jgi:phage protein D
VIAEVVQLSVDGAAQPDLVADVARVEVEEDVDRADAFSVTLSIRQLGDGGWTLVDDERLRPWRRVAVEAGYPDATQTLADGYVTHVDADLREDGDAHVVLSGLDASALMDLEDRQLAWPNKADSDIARTVFTSYGLTDDVEDTADAHPEAAVTVLQSDTDIRFLRRLAARNGYECRVQGRTGLFRRPDLQEPPQPVLALAFGTETNLVSARFSVEGTPPTEPEIRRVDPFAKQEDRRSLTTTTERLLGADTLEAVRGDQPAGRALVRRHGAASLTELDAALDGARSGADRFVGVEGEVDSRAYRAVLRAGRLVTIKGAGATHSGLYYVTRVHHVFTPEGYRQRFWARRNGLGLTGEEQFG